jgi:phosphoketolase
MLDLATIRHQDPVVSLAYEENHRTRAARSASTRPTAVAVRTDQPRQQALLREQAALTRQADPDCAHWAAGYGLIHHDDLTQVRVAALARRLVDSGAAASTAAVYQLFAAADRLCSAGMWLVVHQTYADRVFLDGRPLGQEDFKLRPEGHTGGSLNMVPGYAGYLLANALTGQTRSWMMGPGHCVSAIDSLNVLMGNLDGEQARRYGLSDAQLTDFVRDFYSYRVTPAGKVAVPMGSHVNAHTAGGISEGGYLGFAELTYPHMPLPGERLVAFLSDGAFEEQRGSDWAARWWRAEDCGMVTPILLANGRRIDQRSAIYQNGGVEWLKNHLQINHFDPIVIDGRDPAAFAWAVIEMEERLRLWSVAIANGEAQYPIPLPHAIAEAPKGFGFPGQATNDAHNLPLGANPRDDEAARRAFITGVQALHVPVPDLHAAISRLSNHHITQRVQEKDHALAHRSVATPLLPEPAWSAPQAAGKTAPMVALDGYLAELLTANPGLRPRIGNPDEMRSNRLNRTLDTLKHRVCHPEPGMAEAVDGSVITALNEEAVVCAALGNKGGINLVATYEAFAMKMLGAVRQELIFARHQSELGKQPGWLSVPVILTSHTWENGKNEQSHQDPTFAEAALGEMNDRSRVVFPIDANSALSCLRGCYQSHGQIWTMVVPKNPLPDVLSPAQAEELTRAGALRLRGEASAPLILIAVGAYQCREVLRASDRLLQRGLSHAVVALLEPGRFRAPRDAHEGQAMADAQTRSLLHAPQGMRIAVTHTRPEAIMGVLAGGDDADLSGASHPETAGAGARARDVGGLRVLGYRNQGGTLDVSGMLFANRCTAAHILSTAAGAMGWKPSQLLTPGEIAALHGRGDPRVVMSEASSGAAAPAVRSQGRP